MDPCLARLERAIAAARALEVPTANAETVRSDAEARLGFPSDACVVALVGGTGVGKSSLLNALAGTDISRASVRRPTTARPVAWLPRASAAELADLLDWLGVASEDIHATGQAPLPGIAILDLPDIDSTDAEHRARVEAILPRVDAVVWVTDPEKYHDAVLHDELLNRWLPRLARQLVVVNKCDRLTPDQAESVRKDLARDLARLDVAAGGLHRASPTMAILASVTADVPGTGTEELRGWLAEQAETKAVIRSRLVASIRVAILELARAGGIEPGESVPPLVSVNTRSRALDDATAVLLRIVDLPTLERQAVAATRARARARGAGPLGGITSLLYRWSGRQARMADPIAFLARWRDRGELAVAVEPLRAAYAEALRAAPPGTRQLLARGVAADRVERELGRAVDQAVARRSDEVPSSRVWPVVGLAQTVTSLALIVTAIWVALWVVVKFPVDMVGLPGVGHVPAPFVVLITVLALGYLFARVLGLHAGWVGRRWARRLARDVRTSTEREVATIAFGAVDAIEIGRRSLSTAARSIEEDCRVS
jgi:GTP-binding protein EngB required for normal cell division